MGSLNVISHPLIEAKLTRMRDKNTSSQDFRLLLKEISILMGYEITRNFETVDAEVETPICVSKFPVLKESFFTIVPILRAGLGMVDGVLELMPAARVGHLGMFRDEETHEPHVYYDKLPADIASRQVLVVDPMLATGGSAAAAVRYLREAGVRGTIKLMVLVAAPEGIEAVLASDPDVRVYTCAVDEGLNENAYIVPGLGDAGDRIFGTK